MTATVAVGILVAGGVFLILRPNLARVAFGFILLGHAVNILLVSAGGLARRKAPLVGQADPDMMADPLPQAFVLTAIVITFGITVYLLGLARASSAAGSDTPPPDDDAESSPEPPGSVGSHLDD